MTETGYETTKIIGICGKCGKHFDDYKGKPHRKYICRECFNYNSKTAARRLASTPEGYLKATMNNIKNSKRRNRYYNDVDLDFLIELYNTQEGRCAISGIEMTLGYGTSIGSLDKFYRNPYNLSIDRIDNDKGYTRDNVMFVCNCINFFKNNISAEDVFSIAAKICANHKQYKQTMSRIEKLYVDYYQDKNEVKHEAINSQRDRRTIMGS